MYILSQKEVHLQSLTQIKADLGYSMKDNKHWIKTREVLIDKGYLKIIYHKSQNDTTNVTMYVSNVPKLKTVELKKVA